MKFKSPSLPELHAFLAVCKLGNFSRAAEALCVTQAAVSRSVQRLEQRLECPLFERTASGVVPTARGNAFQAAIQPHVAGLESAAAFFDADTGSLKSSKRKLRLSVVPTLGTRWLMPRLAAFQSVHPDIQIELRQVYHDENFKRDDVDLWISVKRPLAWPRGYRAEYLLGKEICPACTPTIAARLSQAKNLLTETLLYHTNSPDNWSLWLSAAGISSIEPKLGTGLDLGSNLIVAACAGMGVTVIQPCLIEGELATGQLVMPFDLRASTERGYYLSYSPALAKNQPLQTFVAWLHQQAKTPRLTQT